MKIKEQQEKKSFENINRIDKLLGTRGKGGERHKLPVLGKSKICQSILFPQLG